LTLWGDVSISAWTGSPSGNLRVHGLPFVNENERPETAVLVIVHSGINLSAGYTQVVGNIQTNSQNIRFYEIGDNVTAQLIQASQVTPTLRLQVFAQYRRVPQE
jgi:hypothetical protein